MSKLTPEQIEEYFKKHLPYRNRILTAHKNLCALGTYQGNPAILDASFEASLITGRMYLNVLGVTKNNNSIDIIKKYKPDDLNAVDLGGKLIDQSTLPQIDKDDFFSFLIMADKGAAHLTLPRQHSWENTHVVIDKIVSYVKSHIYLPANRIFEQAT
jgi:hypothetical protein